MLKCARALGRQIRRQGPAARAGHCADVHDRRNRRQHLPRDAGLDTLDILVLWKGFPTYASTQTIFTILKAKWYYLEQKKFVEWDVTARSSTSSVPGQHETAIAVPWGGTAHPGVVQE